MANIKAHLFGNRDLAPNTFIGGVGATTVTSASDLATKLNVLESDIKAFVIDGLNVSCNINKPYRVLARAFELDLNITYFINTDENLISIGESNLIVDEFQFFSATNMACLVGLGIQSTGRQSLNVISAEDYYLPNMTLSGLRNFFAGKEYTLYAPLLTIISTATFGGFGGYNYNNSIFYLNVLFQTSGPGGTVEPQVQNIITRGGTVKYILDTTPPNAITDLTVTAITATTAIVNFTAPSSLNGIDYYDVFMDDGSILSKYLKKQKITASGTVITGLISGVTYNVKIRTYSGYGTRSNSFSNIINFTTL